MPIIRVELFKGRDVAQKRKLVKALTDAFIEAAGGNPAGVHVIISDIEKCDWGSGGELCSDKYPD